jgi:CDP-paratose synthetase
MSSKKTILLTGGTGFTGSHLLAALIKEDFDIILLKRSTSATWRIREWTDLIETIDVDRQPLESAFKGKEISTVIHTACQYGRNQEDISELVESNVLFPLRLLETASKFKVDKFINFDTFFNTTSSTYEHLSHYSKTKKHFIDWLVGFSDLHKIINLRFGHIYGPYDAPSKFVPWILSQLQLGIDSVSLTEGSQLRDFIYIDDVISAVIFFLKRQLDEGYNSFDIGSGKLTTVRCFVEMVKKEIEVQKGCPCVTRLGFGDLSCRHGEIMEPDMDCRPVFELGWSPRATLEYGISSLIRESID